MKTKLIFALLIALMFVLVFMLSAFWVRPMPPSSGDTRPRITSDVEEASDTCISNADPVRVVVLHVSKGGRTSINSETVGDLQLPQRLQQIYGSRAERFLYLLADKDAPSRRIAEIVGVVQHLPADAVNEWPVPKDLEKSASNLLNVQVRLVTARAINAPCPRGYFNWATHGLPVSP